MELIFQIRFLILQVFLMLLLYFLKIQGSAQLLPISATPQPVQIIRLGRLPALLEQ